MKIVPRPIQFEWDKGNAGKNYDKHKVTNQECEEAFFDPKKKMFKDILHSGEEERHLLLGKTKLARTLFIAFTIRGNRVRVISARDLNKKELALYEEKNHRAKI